MCAKDAVSRTSDEHLALHDFQVGALHLTPAEMLETKGASGVFVQRMLFSCLRDEQLAVNAFQVRTHKVTQQTKMSESSPCFVCGLSKFWCVRKVLEQCTSGVFDFLRGGGERFSKSRHGSSGAAMA